MFIFKYVYRKDILHDEFVQFKECYNSLGSNLDSKGENFRQFTKIMTYFTEVFAYLEFGINASERLFNEMKKDLEIAAENPSYDFIDMEYLQNKTDQLFIIVDNYLEKLKLSESNKTLHFPKYNPPVHSFLEGEGEDNLLSPRSAYEPSKSSFPLLPSEPIYLKEHIYLEALEKKINEVKELKGALVEIVNMTNSPSVKL